MNEIESIFIGSLIDYPRNYEVLGGRFKSEFLEDEQARLIFENYTEDTLAISKKTGIDIKDLLSLSMMSVSGNVFKTYAEKIVQDWKDREKNNILNSSLDDDSINKLSKINQYKLFEKREEVDVSKEYLIKVEKKYRGEKNEDIIPTGFNKVDNLLDEGFEKSELIFLAGSSGAGKTTLALNIAYNIAKEKKRVLFFSLEMKKLEIHERLVKRIAEVPSYRKMSPEQFERLIKISKAVEDRLQLKVYDENISLEQMFGIMKQEKPEIVFIDHLNILTSSERFKTELERLEYMTRRLKEIAKELNIPIVCLCQLNRANSDREIKFPTLSDLRGSGSIEQDANLVIFVYRPEYFLLQLKPDENHKNYKEWEENYKLYKGKAKIIISKNRRGMTGEVLTYFQPEYYKFTECE